MEAKFKVGDLVRCTNPSHPRKRKNPFVIGAINSSIKDGIVYPGEIVVGFHRNNGLVGCKSSELELVKEGE